MNLFNLKKITKIVSDFANVYADRETVQSLVVLDIYPLNAQYIDKKRYLKAIIKLFKDMDNISKKLNIPIIVVYNMSVEKKYNAETCQLNY